MSDDNPKLSSDESSSKRMVLHEPAVPYRALTEADSPSAPESDEDQGWLDFRDQCRRQMQRPLELRIKYGFCRKSNPAPNTVPWRAFDTMAEYRAWCEANLPDYLGFKRPPK